MRKQLLRGGIVAAAVTGAVTAAFAGTGTRSLADSSGSATTTPVRHLVVIFQENVSFDHYFATYPNATNTDGSMFTAAPATPTVNGLNTSLLSNNPNSAQPFRLSHAQAATCDQDHSYTDEQAAADGGLMDKFVETIGRGSSTCADYGHGRGLTMGYYDGNTVTALWNYAQHYAMSDNSYDTNFGPSSVGAVNLISGQTHGFTPDGNAVTASRTMIGDPQPAGDKCDTRDTTTAESDAKNIGDLLNAHGVTWGWFEGGFADCSAAHTNRFGQTSRDYIPHHEPFQFYASTANPQHLPPTSVDMIGRTDQANHQYDLANFWQAVGNGNEPAVSFLKAPAYQDGHAGYSNPLDEQAFLVDTINRLQDSKEWKSTAIVIAYDDSDGWYDHQLGPIVNQSNDPAVDRLRPSAYDANGVPAAGDCGTTAAQMAGGFEDRCGYGPRLPLLVVSPFAKTNFVDRTTTDQTSVLRFIEDNWQTGRIDPASFDRVAGTLDNMFDFTANAAHKLTLDPTTGQAVTDR